MTASHAKRIAAKSEFMHADMHDLHAAASGGLQ